MLIGLRSASACRRRGRLTLIVAFATFVGEVVEGMVIDTDHWRHFFLLLGMIWGLAAATRDYKRASLVPGSAAGMNEHIRHIEVGPGACSG